MYIAVNCHLFRLEDSVYQFKFISPQTLLNARRVNAPEVFNASQIVHGSSFCLTTQSRRSPCRALNVTPSKASRGSTYSLQGFLSFDYASNRRGIRLLKRYMRSHLGGPPDAWCSWLRTLRCLMQSAFYLTLVSRQTLSECSGAKP